MKRILFITVAFFMSFAAMAQENEEWFGHDVEGFCIGQRMNYKQFVAKFGKPDRYEANGGDESYYIGEDYFHFGQDGLFLDFVLESPRFAALTKYIKGGIRVGDKLSKLDNFKYGKPVEIKYGFKPEKGVIKYALFSESDEPVFLLVKDGIITVIFYFEIP
ncbi:MAG: hypothetical protein ACTTGW_04790 [Candidatus Cryptobacteroides sp.]